MMKLEKRCKMQMLGDQELAGKSFFTLGVWATYPGPSSLPLTERTNRINLVWFGFFTGSTSGFVSNGVKRNGFI